MASDPPMMDAKHADEALHDAIHHYEGVALSGKAMKAFAAPGTHIFMEHELVGKNRSWMVGSTGAYIMLYEFPGKAMGHWICGWAQPDGSVHHFDPYGKPPNCYIQKKTYLNVLQEGKYTYSHIDFQGHNRSIDTCGRHCLVRLMFRDHTDQEYSRLVHRNGNADEVVTLMTLHATFNN